MRGVLRRVARSISSNSIARLPDSLYPFTFDEGYDHCLLDLRYETHGCVHYLAVKAKTFGEPGYGWDQVGVVAGSFSEFLTGLEPDYL
ncbi:hypothetical protein FHX11_003074 [Rhizobium sp. BK602]|nr:hypothetical protein [Rhizobium sp. BK602]